MRLAVTGNSNVNVEPRPTVERTPTGWPSMRATRSTMARPRPRPRTLDAVSSKRWNSLKTTASFSFGMPGPVSAIETVTVPPLSRALSTTVPRAVYLIAFETRFCSNRRSNRRSDTTQISVLTTCNVSAFRAAIGANSMLNFSNKPPSDTGVMSGAMRPASSRAMSISVLSISSTPSRDASMLCAIWASVGGRLRSIRLDMYSRAAFSGCITSWLAAAKKRVLSRLASSALRRATSTAAIA